MKQQPLTITQLQMLHSNLHPRRVLKRQQGGATLSYLEAWDIRAMLIRVFGYAGFSAEVIDSRIVHEAQYKAPNSDRMLWRIGAQCTVRLTIHQTGAVYTETAVASQSGPDWGDVADFAIKTATSDSLKRAAINLGTQFGLSLYQDGTTEDVVRQVVAPTQFEEIRDVVAARSAGPEGNDARARLQERFKRQTAPDDTTPEQAESDARQAAAVAALAEAEAVTGVTPVAGAR